MPTRRTPPPSEAIPPEARFVESAERPPQGKKRSGPRSVSELMIAAGVGSMSIEDAKEKLRCKLGELAAEGWRAHPGLVRSLRDLGVISADEARGNDFHKLVSHLR